MYIHLSIVYNKSIWLFKFVCLFVCFALCCGNWFWIAHLTSSWQSGWFQETSPYPHDAHPEGGCHCRVVASPAELLLDPRFWSCFWCCFTLCSCLTCWCAASSQLAGSRRVASRWAPAKTSSVQGVVLKAHIVLACIEAKNLQRELLVSVHLCINMKCSSVEPDFSAILSALCTTVNSHFPSYKITLSG